jgi:hypothetical protein
MAFTFCEVGLHPAFRGSRGGNRGEAAMQRVFQGRLRLFPRSV